MGPFVQWNRAMKHRFRSDILIVALFVATSSASYVPGSLAGYQSAIVWGSVIGKGA